MKLKTIISATALLGLVGLTSCDNLDSSWQNVNYDPTGRSLPPIEFTQQPHQPEIPRKIVTDYDSMNQLYNKFEANLNLLNETRYNVSNQ